MTPIRTVGSTVSRPVMDVLIRPPATQNILASRTRLTAPPNFSATPWIMATPSIQKRKKVSMSPITPPQAVVAPRFILRTAPLPPCIATLRTSLMPPPSPPATARAMPAPPTATAIFTSISRNGLVVLKRAQKSKVKQYIFQMEPIFSSRHYRQTKS